jgi:glycerol-3-phosphate dehydrogenase
MPTTSRLWTQGWRDRIWSDLDQPWDLIVIGGGITGAGILREATRAGLRSLLVEAHDFACGTSSRSSKLVHGGFRYLKNAQIKMTLRSVRERERLLREGRGLISQLGFLLTSYSADGFPTWVFGVGLTLYDLLALKFSHRYYDAKGLQALCPELRNQDLVGGYRYFDAQTDDARLVLRVIKESVQDGATALNYSSVVDFCRTRSGQVCGVILSDLAPEEAGRTIEIQAPVVINASGAWVDGLRAKAVERTEVLRSRHLRKLRGSHLVFPAQQLPLTRAVSLFHPTDGRPVFAFPWEGVTIIGTTDVDHTSQGLEDPSISPAEAEYLLAAVKQAFPSLNLDLDDVQCTFSGIRSVVDTGKTDPSKESREHVLWEENGLLSVTGGKLTTFRLTAHDALEKVSSRLPGPRLFDAHQRVLDPPPDQSIKHPDLDRATWIRLLGRYGAEAPDLVDACRDESLSQIEGTPSLWGELRWAARAEGVVHLDDLLLRRVRLGLLLPQGGLRWIDQIRDLVQPELGWDEDRWQHEILNYENLWKRSYSLN